MHLTEDFPLSSRLISKTFRDEQKINPNYVRNIWKLLARTRPEADPNPNTTRTRPEPDPKNPIPTVREIASMISIVACYHSAKLCAHAA